MSQLKPKTSRTLQQLLLGLLMLLLGFSVRSQPAAAAADCSDVFTPLSSFVVDGVNRNKSLYIQVMNETGVPWEMLAAIHYRETNFSRTNPSNGQGIFQFVNGDGGPYPPGPVSDGEFTRQLRYMAGRVQNDYVFRGSVPRERRNLVANEQNIAIVKDALFSYNGRASAYINQAGQLGYNQTTQPYEGSPYVMNRFDCARARMGIITRDYATGIDGTDTRYGAFTLFARLRGDNYRNSLLQPFSWQMLSSEAYIDSARTKRFTSRITVPPHGKIYIRVKALNTGSQTWDSSFMRVGTANPYDSASQVYDSSWLNTSRPGKMSENTVAPGAIGTFDFTLGTPHITGTYRGQFNLVAEGRSWLNENGLIFGVNVVSPINAINNTGASLAAGASLLPKQYLLSPDAQSVLQLQEDGNLVLKSNFVPIWSSGTSGQSAVRLTMQADGNLVLYNSNNQALWHTSTGIGSPGRLDLQADGNLVLYSQANAPLWATSTFSVPDHLAYVNPSLPTTRVMHPGQQIETADRRYRTTLQADGNLVLYKGSQALWSSGTSGREVGYLTMQADGNLVLYGADHRPLWNSRTSDRGPSYLEMQADGNLVLYDIRGLPTWSTGTSGR